MQNEQHQKDITSLTGKIFGQSVDHFDPFQGFTDHEEQAERLRHLRYGFQIGGQNILLSRQMHCEVVQHVSIYRIPNTRSWVLGIINLRGNLVPVFDFLKRMDKTTVRVEDQQLLVLDQGERAVGIYIDALPQGLQIDPDDPKQRAVIPAELPDSIRDYISGAFHCNDQIWLEVDHRELFAELLSDSGVPAATLT